jgi:hypothetical protein
MLSLSWNDSLFCETFSFVQHRNRNCTNHRQQNKVRGRVIIWFFRARPPGPAAACSGVANLAPEVVVPPPPGWSEREENAARMDGDALVPAATWLLVRGEPDI